MVLDASAVIECLLRTKRGDLVSACLASGARSVHAPHVLDLEVAQVLRRFCASAVLNSVRAMEALQDLRDMGIHRYPHEPMLARIWQLRANFTAYDAAYIALAETLGATLVTFDARLSNAPGHAARVEVLR